MTLLCNTEKMFPTHLFFKNQQLFRLFSTTKSTVMCVYPNNKALTATNNVIQTHLNTQMDTFKGFECTLWHLQYTCKMCLFLQEWKGGLLDSVLAPILSFLQTACDLPSEDPALVHITHTLMLMFITMSMIIFCSYVLYFYAENELQCTTPTLSSCSLQ